MVLSEWQQEERMKDFSGWLWLLIDVALVGGLGLGLAYGVAAWQRRRKDPKTEQIRDAATHRAYTESDANRP